MMYQKRIKFVLSVCLAILCFAAGSWAAGNENRLAEGEDRAPAVNVTIAKKTREQVKTNVGDTFSVSRSTLIIGTDGKQVSIEKMLVPCDARITYQYENGNRVAERIQQTRISNNATWKWLQDRSE